MRLQSGSVRACIQISHLYPRHFASCRERWTRSVARPRPLAAGETAIILMSKSSNEFALENASLLRAWQSSSFLSGFNFATHLGLQQDGGYWSKFWVQARLNYLECQITGEYVDKLSKSLDQGLPPPLLSSSRH